MTCHQFIVMKQLDVSGMDTCGQWLPNQMSWNRIAIGLDGNQAFPTHNHAIIEAVVLRRLWKLAKMGVLLSQYGEGKLTCGITNPFSVDVTKPLLTLLG